MPTVTEQPKESQRDAKYSPAYKRIESDLRTRIGRREWMPGVMIPGRRDLAKEYGVDLMTLQRAIAKLLDDETLVASGRRGTFVNATPPATARSLTGTLPRPAKTLTIGVVGLSVDDYSRIEPRELFFNHTFLAAFESTLQSARNVDFTFVPRNTPNGDMITVADTLAVLDERDVDGIVFLFADAPSDIDEISRLVMGSELPMVMTSSRHIEVPVPLIYYDNFAAGFEAAWSLIQAGERRITLVSPFDEYWVRERLIGIRKAIEHAGLPADALSIWPASDIEPLGSRNQLQVGKETGAELFAAHPQTSAVIAINDFVAMGLVSSARKLGRMAGKHFRLVSFDDIPQAAMAGISSMRPPLDIMGRESAKMMLQLIDGDRDISQVRLKSRLVVRSSMRGDG
ncbi:MAG TPA: GntR family transcriptional regulator [Capsulimonadaceae bacterium]|jgi:DNA-binding LacI/PurR family transcriptional regulator